VRCERRDYVAALTEGDVGKSQRDAFRADVVVMLHRAAYYLGISSIMLRSRRDAGPSLAMIHNQIEICRIPGRVAVVISRWNYRLLPAAGVGWMPQPWWFTRIDRSCGMS